VRSELLGSGRADGQSVSPMPRDRPDQTGEAGQDGTPVHLEADQFGRRRVQQIVGIGAHRGQSGPKAPTKAATASWSTSSGIGSPRPSGRCGRPVGVPLVRGQPDAPAGARRYRLPVEDRQLAGSEDRRRSSAAGASKRTGANRSPVPWLLVGPDRRSLPPGAAPPGTPRGSAVRARRPRPGGQLLSAGREPVVTVGCHGSAHDHQRVVAVECAGQGFGGVGPALIDFDTGGRQGLADGVGGLGFEVLDNQAARHVTMLSLRGQRLADRSRCRASSTSSARGARPLRMSGHAAPAAT